MERDGSSYFEKAVYGLRGALERWRVPYFTAMAAGLLSYMFAFTNKLVNHDEITCLFGKGMDVSSGRWGLVLIRAIFPDYSMPWLYGAVSLVLLSAAICLMLSTLKIRNRVVQAVLAAVVITFPAQLDTFCYMFVSSAYAAAVLLAVLSAWLFARKTRGRWVVCPALLALSMGIYQAYLALPASLLVLLLIRRCMDGDDCAEIFRDGLRYVGMLAASAAAYYAVMLLFLAVSGETLNSYAAGGLGEGRLIRSLVQAYAIFPRLLFRGWFGYVTEGLSRAMHCVCVFLAAIELLAAFITMREPKRRGLFVLLIVLFPLSISFIHLISSTVHTLVLYGFVCVYLLFGVLADGRIDPRRSIEKDILLTAMTLITLSNVTFANSIYLKQYLQYENAMAFYTEVVTQIKMNEDYDPGCAVAVIGDAGLTLYDEERIPGGYLAGMAPTLVNVYSRDDFMRYYVGFDVGYATYQEKAAIMETEEFASMPSYPYSGSIQRIGDYMVVKLGE